MKFLSIGVVAAVFAAGACNRADTAAAPPPSGTGAAAATAPSWQQVTIPAGTQLPIVLETTVASNTSRVEEPVQARLSRAVLVHGVTALPEGSRVSGVVVDAKESGRVKGRAHVAIRFDSIVPRGEDERYTMHSAAVGRTAEGTKKKDALEIGAPAAGGALIGALVGGKKGALIGTGVGGGAGTAYVLSTRGQEVRLAKGAPITLKLVEPLTVKIRS
ncbi:MAG TPA: hypothetical protein VGJ29_07645 [Vicinamibacterales bacterium]|jgi:hypothetical protein